MNSQSLNSICINLASPFFLAIFRVFVVEQFGGANKENTSYRMDKSINMNLVGNTESFGSSINSTLSIKILEGSNKMFPFVKSWLVSTSSFTLPSSSTTGFEVFLYLYWDIFSYEYLLLLICLVQHSQLPWSLILLGLSICNNHLQIFHSHSHRITTL